MKTIWKIIGISIASGLALSVLGFSLGANLNGLYLDKAGVHIVSYDETRITELDLENFSSIDVDVDYCDVEFVAAEKFGIDLCSYDGEINWDLENSTLRVKNKNNAETRWSFFVFNTTPKGKNYVKIYLPKESELETVSISTDSGNVKVGGFEVKDAQIHSGYGDANLDSIISGSLRIDLGSGNASGTTLTSESIVYNNGYGKGTFDKINVGNLTADISSGDVTLSECKAGSVVINSGYGTVTADSLVASGTNIRADSGNISISGDLSGETEIHSGYGNIKFAASKEKGYYNCDISTEYGKIIFDGEKIGSDTTVRNAGESQNQLKIGTSSGDIEVSFAK